MKFIKMSLFCSLIAFGLSTTYTDLQKEKIGDEVMMKMLEEIFREAMEIKRNYQANVFREEILENLSTTAPREEFVINADLSDELADSEPVVTGFVSTDGQNSWFSSSEVGPINETGFESTWGGTVMTSGGNSVHWFLSSEVNSEALGYDYGVITVTQSPDNTEDEWPLGDNLFATMVEDPEDDAPSGQDIYSVEGSHRGGEEDIDELYIKISMSGGCCETGSIFGPWYLYGVGLVNPESEASVAYAIGYGDGGFGQLTPGLLKISGDLATGEIGGFEYLTTDISYDLSGDDLQTSVLMSYIINDSDWGEWPNSFNGVVTLGMTIEASLSGFDVAAEILDQTNPGFFLLSSQQQFGNAEPVVTNAQFDADSWTMSVDYSDADGNLPWFRSGQVCYPAGACFLFLDLIPDAHTYADGVGYAASFASEDIADGDYELHFWFEDDDEIGAAQVVLPVTLGEGGGCGVTGDVNGDGAVNVVDVVVTVNLILGGQPYDECVDLNGDGAINVIDVVQLVNIILAPEF